MAKKTLSLDFDGVIHSYTSGWRGAWQIPDPPTEGAFVRVLEALDHPDWHVVVHSSRLSHHLAGDAMVRWFIHHGFPASRLATDLVYHPDQREGDYVSPRDQLQDEFPTVGTKEPLLRFSAEKPAAFVTLDDRALTFTGVWPTLAELAAFKTWQQRDDLPLPTSDPAEKLLLALAWLRDREGKVINLTADDLGNFGKLLLTPDGRFYAQQLLAALR